MLGRILDAQQQALVARERRALSELTSLLARAELSAEDRDALADSIAQLDELFLLVVVGEFNAGKSAFVNALLGSRLLEEGVTPTTSRVHWIRFGEERRSTAIDGGVLVLEAPIELLQEIHLVDTPGTNAITREHEALTRRFVPRSDLVLFVTSADRPFTESERAFLEGLREWGKKVVVAINKIDILPTEQEVSQVVDFVADSCHRLLGFTPRVFPLSARRAAVERGLDPAGPEAEVPPSGMEALEKFIQQELDADERLRLKLSNPLGVGSRLLAEELARCRARLQLLAADFQTLDDLSGQLELYHEDMAREFGFRLGDVDRHLHELENRGTAFFDETLRLGRLPDLLSKSRIQRDFERQVVGDMPQQIEGQVDDIIDWMVSSELRRWQAVRDLVAERENEHRDRIVGDAGALEANRRQLLDTVGRAAQRAVDGYDRQKEALRLAESTRNAVAGAALLEVGAGALGLGSVITAVVSSTAVDITGVLAAGTLAALGLFVLPARKRRAKASLRRSLSELRERLISGLSSEFEGEMDRSLHRLQEATAPYRRFVRSQRETLESRQERLRAHQAELSALANEVQSLH